MKRIVLFFFILSCSSDKNYVTILKSVEKTISVDELANKLQIKGFDSTSGSAGVFLYEKKMKDSNTLILITRLEKDKEVINSIILKSPKGKVLIKK